MFSDKKYKELNSRFKNIILNLDNDDTGIKFSKKWKDIYSDIKLFFIPEKSKTKDISDYIEKYGLEKTKKLLINI